MTDTRQRLLATALEVFAERGADGGSMREIAKRAGVNVATTYHHFSSKRDLLLAIFAELGFLDMSTDLTPLSGEDAPAEERLAHLIFGAWMQLHTGRDVVKIMLGEAFKGDDEVRSVFDTWRERGDGWIAQGLLGSGLADEGNVTARAWIVRQVIWATFIETLIYDDTDLDALYPQAVRGAAEIIGAWR